MAEWVKIQLINEYLQNYGKTVQKLKNKHDSIAAEAKDVTSNRKR